MTRILAGVFAICAAACAFDQSGAPNQNAGQTDPPDAQQVIGSPDAAPAPIDAAPPSPPDACMGKKCGDGGGGPGGGGPGPG